VRRVVATALVLFAAGCPAGDTPPPGGGGGGGGGNGGGGGDADGGGGGDGGGLLIGKLCAAVDLRIPLACPAADLGGILVASEGKTATTDDSGGFALDLDPARDHLISESGGNQPVREALFASAMWQTDGMVRAPAVSRAEWDDLVALIGAFEPDGTASIALYIEDQNGPIANAEVVPPDGTAESPFYDGTSAVDWNPEGATSGFGAALLFGVQNVGGSAELSIAVETKAYTVTVPVRDDTLTFARAFIDTSGT
jgi:hypothetical protein